MAEERSIPSQDGKSADLIAEGIIRGVGGLVQRFLLVGTLALSGLGGLFVASNSAFYLPKDSYADVDNGGATRERVTGRGVHFTNPFKTFGVYKWSLQNKSLTLASQPAEKEQVKIDLNTTFYGEPGDSGELTTDALNLGLGTAEATIRDIFQKNAWTSYRDIDPHTHSANSKAVCNALSQRVPDAMRLYLRDVKVTGCEISVKP